MSCSYIRRRGTFNSLRLGSSPPSPFLVVCALLSVNGRLSLGPSDSRASENTCFHIIPNCFLLKMALTALCRCTPFGVRWPYWEVVSDGRVEWFRDRNFGREENCSLLNISFVFGNEEKEMCSLVLYLRLFLYDCQGIMELHKRSHWSRFLYHFYGHYSLIVPFRLPVVLILNKNGAIAQTTLQYFYLLHKSYLLVYPFTEHPPNKLYAAEGCNETLLLLPSLNNVKWL